MGAEKTQQPRRAERLDDEQVGCGWVSVERHGPGGGFDFSERAHETLGMARNRRPAGVRIEFPRIAA